MQSRAAVTRALREDHRRIREQLVALDATLAPPVEGQAVRTACQALVKSLQRHIRRTLDVPLPYAPSVGGLLRLEALYDATADRVALRQLEAFLMLGRSAPAGKIVAYLSRVADDLRGHVALRGVETSSR